MASEKQIAANRLNALNALNSTGPATPEAKAKTRLNAMRDGVTGQVITLSEEDSPVFDKLKTELIEDLAPKSTMELHPPKTPIAKPNATARNSVPPCPAPSPS